MVGSIALSPTEFASLSTWLSALWMLTALLAAPMLIGALLGGRRPGAQRRIVRAVFVAAPVILIAGVLLPDPLGGRPLLQFDLQNDLSEEASSALVDGEPLTDLPTHSDRSRERRGDPIAVAESRAEDHLRPLSDLQPIPFGRAPSSDDLSATGPSGLAPTPSRDAGRRVDLEESAAVVHSNTRTVPTSDPGEVPLSRGAFTPAPLAPLPPVAPAPLPTDRRRALASDIPATGPLAPITHPTALADPSTPRPTAEADEVRAGAARASSLVPPTRRATSLDAWPPLVAATPGSRLALARSVLLFIWAVGAAYGLLRLAGSLLLLDRLRRRASAVGSTRGIPSADPALGEVPVRIIPGLGSAAAVGLFSPEVWLPARWSAQLDRPSLQTLLGHELAHHRGRDPLWRVVTAAVGAILWPHPLVHLLRRREEHLCELVADRRVLENGTGPRRYAELLAHLAADATGATAPLAAGVLGTRSPLERRIRLILSTPTDLPRRRRGGWATPALLGACCVAVLGLSAAYPLVGEACDPIEAKIDATDVRLEDSEGHWVVIGTHDGKTTWKVRVGDVASLAEPVLRRSGRFVRVRDGDRVTVSIDVTDGRIATMQNGKLVVTAPSESVNCQASASSCETKAPCEKNSPCENSAPCEAKASCDEQSSGAPQTPAPQTPGPQTPGPQTPGPLPIEILEPDEIEERIGQDPLVVFAPGNDRLVAWVADRRSEPLPHARGAHATARQSAHRDDGAARIAALEAELARRAGELRALEAQLAHARAEDWAERHEQADPPGGADEAHVHELERHLADLEAALAERTHEIESRLAREVDRQARRLDQQRAMLAARSAELTAELESRLVREQVAAESAALRAALVDDRDARADLLRREHADRAASIEATISPRLRRDRRSLEGLEEQLQRQVEELNATLPQLQTQLAEISRAIEQSVAESLERAGLTTPAPAVELEHLVQDLEAALEAERARNAALEEENARLRKKLEAGSGSR